MNFKKVISVLLIMIFVSGNFSIVRAKEKKNVNYIVSYSDAGRSYR